MVAPFLLHHMDYKKHYDALVSRAKDRTLVGYSERHHIIPKCMGGSNDPENLVRLTAEEHFVAHKLLVMMYPGNNKLVFAAWGMTNLRKSSNQVHRAGNKLYGWLRQEHQRASSESQKGRKATEEIRAKMRAAAARNKDNVELKEKRHQALLGRKKSAESIAKMKATLAGQDYKTRQSASHTGKKHTEETKEKIRLSKIGKPRPPELMEKLRLIHLGRKITPEEKQKRSVAMKKRWADKKLKQQETLFI